MDNASFLSAIADEPDADASRRVYADWLDDHGDAAQAEFIRLQLTMAETDEWSERRPALAARERELLTAHAMRWARVLIDGGALGWNFRRGTLNWATMTLADFLRHGDEVMRHSPVRRFRLKEIGDLSELASSPLLGRVRRLNLTREDEQNDDSLDDVAMTNLAGSPHLGRMDALDLSWGTFGVVGLAALLGAPSLGRLEKLSLQGCRLGGEGVALLTRSPALAGLRVLNLASAKVALSRRKWSGEPLRELRELNLSHSEGRFAHLEGPAALHAFPRLRKLNVRRRHVPEDFATMLANAPAAASLHWLACGEPSPEGLAALLRLPCVHAAARLRVRASEGEEFIGLQRCRVGYPGGEFCLADVGLPDGVAGVLRSADLPNLRWLGLHTYQNDGLVADLAGSTLLAQLDVLDLRETPLSAADFRRLDDVQSNELQRLAVGHRGYYLHDPLPEQATTDAVRALASSTLAARCAELPDMLARLEWPEEWRSHVDDPDNLCLWSHDLGDEAMARLAEVPALSRVRHLDVGGNDLTSAGLRALLASPHLTGLRTLRLSFNDGLNAEAAALVAGCAKLAGLLSLKMSYCPIGDAGAKAIAESPHLTDLRVLKLWDCGIGPDGVRALAASPTLRRLVALRLLGNPFGEAGALALAASPFFEDLMFLYLDENATGAAGLAALRRRFGGRLRFFDGDPVANYLW